MNARSRIGAIALAVVAIGTLPALAGSSSTNVNVSVQVLSRAVVSVDSQPAAVTVTAEDIARGYVDVPAPIVVRVRTNSRQGYLLHAENQGETFSSIELSTADIAMNVGAHETWIQRPYISGGDVMPMRARLHLAAAATIGSFSLPIAFSASPL
jgi:hypothetical protein